MFSAHHLVLITWCSPLIASVLAAFLQYRWSRDWAHRVVLLGLGVAVVAAWTLGYRFYAYDDQPFSGIVYTWFEFGTLTVPVGYRVDALAMQMMAMCTLVSFAVGVYSIGYMQDEDGYAHFFAYVSLFVFMMLNMVLADNLVLFFFGWEGMGVVSYLLIGFYIEKPSASFSALRAFVVNRVGDIGLAVGIAGCFYATGSVDIQTVIQRVPTLTAESFSLWGDTSLWLLPTITTLWFVGVMAKSAQMPLHVWLPGSMEGPTPISALIHAATMVTAGVYLVARFAALYALVPWVSECMAVIGASGALWLGIIGIYENDIKRVVAYSTLSQLGYMVAALGLGGYGLAVFHLLTHAYFKSLLFLCTGAIKLVCKTQDIRSISGLKTHYPLLMICHLVGALSLLGMPPFSGFFSKESIIALAHTKHTVSFLAGYVTMCLQLGVFVTGVYIFRVFWSVFVADEASSRLQMRTPLSVWCYAPIVALSVPACGVGALGFSALVEGRLFQQSVVQNTAEQVLFVKHSMQSVATFIRHGVAENAFWLALAALAFSYYRYVVQNRARNDYLPWRKVFANGYGIDWLYQYVVVASYRWFATYVCVLFDRNVVDGVVDKLCGQGVFSLSGRIRWIQNGRLRFYLVAMLLGLALMVLWMLGVANA